MGSVCVSALVTHAVKYGAIGGGWPGASLLLAALTMLAIAGAVHAQTRIGDCTVTAKKGAYPIKPAIPGQLTVETGLPAPGWWNGESPDSIKDGFEYCMAANIAYRGGLDKVRVVNVSFAQLLGGQTKNFDLALTQASITEERKRLSIFQLRILLPISAYWSGRGPGSTIRQ